MSRSDLRNAFAKAIRQTIAAGQEQVDKADARDIDRLVDAVMAVIDKVPSAGTRGWTLVQPDTQPNL